MELVSTMRELFGPNVGLPVLLAIICVELYFIHTHMASKKDVTIAILEHAKEFHQTMVVDGTKFVTGGKSNGKAHHA